MRVREENQTLATVTLQNYFRMYDKLAGMSGTALTEATELNKIYKVGVVEIPTNRPMIRKDQNDQIYKTKEGKWRAVVREIQARHDNQQPVLIGTISVEVSELLSARLRKVGVPHAVKGEAIAVFCVLRRGETDGPELRASIGSEVARELGKALRPDVVEVIPAYDPAGQTAFLAANLAYEMLSLVALRRVAR